MGRYVPFALPLAALAGWLLVPVGSLLTIRPRRVRLRKRTELVKAQETSCENIKLDAEASHALMTSAELSSAIYGTDPKDTREFPPHGWIPITEQLNTDARRIDRPVWALLKSLNEPEGPLYMVFRGTHSGEDLVMDASEVLGLENNTGLIWSWTSVSRVAAATVLNVVNGSNQKDVNNSSPVVNATVWAQNPPRIVVTGHSIGGALAALTSHFLRKAGLDSHAYGFNSPPFLSAFTPHHLRRTFNEHTTLVASEFDPISRILGPNGRPWLEAYHDSVFENRLGFLGRYGSEIVEKLLTGGIMDRVDNITDRNTMDCVWVVALRSLCGDKPLMMNSDENTRMSKAVKTELFAVSDKWLFSPPPPFAHACLANNTVDPHAEVFCTLDHPELLSNRSSQTRLGAANRVVRGLLDPAIYSSPRFIEVYDPLNEHAMLTLLPRLRQLYTEGAAFNMTSDNETTEIKETKKHLRRRGSVKEDKRCTPPLQPWGYGDGLVERLERAYTENTTAPILSGLKTRPSLHILGEEHL